jgi:quinol monooxygenase YgiN
MRGTLGLLLGIALMPIAMTIGAHAQSASTPIHVATYVEVAAPSARNAVALLRQYRDATRQESGNMRAEIAREMGRANRFVMLEIWKDQGALDAHGKSAGTAAFRDKLKVIQNAPYDERVHNAFNVGPNDAIAKRAVVVVSHVDVPPPKKDDVIAALNPLADATRRDPDNLRFEVVQQTSRPNHFTVIEAWKSQKSYDAARGEGVQRQFRDKLGPMLGALYDERLYRPVD